MAIDGELLDEYVEHAGRGAARAAGLVADRLLDAGLAPPLVLRDLVGSAQELVGRRWQRGEWTVRQEHAATEVSMQVIARVSARSEVGPRRGRLVLVAPAEGEWHLVGAAMIRHTLEMAGWDVMAVPPGVRAGQLASIIHDYGPAALLLSCGQPALLPGARRLVVASQDAGTPVVVGGRAFGPSPDRAKRISANAWARDVVAAPEVVETEAGFCPPSRRLVHAAAGDYSRLSADLGAVTAAVSARLAPGSGEVGDGPVEAGIWLVRSLLAALLCNDRSILEEDVAWTEERHGAPPVGPLLDAIAASLPTETAVAREFVESTPRR